MAEVIIVGAGLAGLAISALLARRGEKVEVIEALPAAPGEADASRSINLALSVRGIRTLEQLGITSSAMSHSIPMYGRRIHFPDGSEEFEAYDLVGNNAIHSIRRAHLRDVLLQRALADGVSVRFGARCVDLDCERRVLTLDDGSGRTTRRAFDVLIGCDGANSAVRRALQNCQAIDAETRRIRHGYVEINFPTERAATLRADGLHIWARDEHMLVALPNPDGSLGGTIFLPLEHESSNRLPATRQALLDVLTERFSDATELMEDVPAVLQRNPIGRIFATTCSRWSYAGAVLLLGDAAHSMAPFYGQGMNCALEDCFALMRSIESARGGWAGIFADFERSRRSETDAIVRLSDENYREMSHHAAPSNHKLRREVERMLQLKFPEACVPEYSLVSFSLVPYSQALEYGAKQRRLVDRLVAEVERSGTLDLEQEWLMSMLPSVQGKAPESPHVRPIQDGLPPN